MKRIKKLMIIAIAAMPIFLCSCPGESCVDEHEPKGYVVKMKNDYSDRVIATMFVNTNNDTNYCCVSLNNHTIKIQGDYYKLNSARYNDVAYTSITANEWNNTFLDSLKTYIIDSDPFEEVYIFYHNYDMDALKSIINNNSLNKLERLK